MSKAILWLGFLLTLIILLLSNALQWLTSADYDMLLQAIPYKWQLTILTMIILSLLFALFYNKTFSSSVINDDKQKIGDNKNIMENLSPPEVTKLMLFLEQKSKVINTEYDPTVKILCRNGILGCMTYKANLPSEIMIRERSWEWINNNKDKLKAKL